jgi:hypothetical protein
MLALDEAASKSGESGGRDGHLVRLDDQRHAVGPVTSVWAEHPHPVAIASAGGPQVLKIGQTTVVNDNDAMAIDRGG